MISGPVVSPRSGGPPRHLVLLLHGYGADGADLIGLADPLGAALPDAMFLAPNAPTRCAQNPFGYEWFAIDFADLEGSVRTGTPLARDAVRAYLDDVWVRTGLGPGDTILCGFSQGAMLALHVGLGLPESLLGIVSFSGALVQPEGFGAPEAPRPPVCLIHGDIDDVVPPRLTAEAAERLTGAGYPFSLHISPGTPHGIAPDGLAFATAFMRHRVEAKD